MSSASYIRVRAVHLDWVGCLLISVSDNSIIHEGHNSRGTFVLAEGLLTVYWDRYKPETFRHIAGCYVQSEALSQIPTLDGLFSARIGSNFMPIKTVELNIPDHAQSVIVRPMTSDVALLRDIFVDMHYDSKYLPHTANYIIDLGANIGLAAMFFAMKYEAATIIAVEPDFDNYDMLRRNLRTMENRVFSEYGAVWTRDGTINLQTADKGGKPLGSWGIRVTDDQGDGAEAPATPCFRLSTILRKYNVKDIDILKVDIEGAELELFSSNAQEWLSMVRLVIIETHDRFRPGSQFAVRTALGELFEEAPSIGENLIFRRKLSSMRPY